MSGKLPQKNHDETSKWDVKERTRTSAFPWRGQFTPDLVSNFFEEFDPKIGLVLDPFMGSGTVIAEGIARDRGVVGVELNPAAFILSRLFGLSVVPVNDRLKSFQECKRDLRALQLKFDEVDLFDEIARKISKIQNENKKIILSTVFLLSANNSNVITEKTIEKSFKQVENVLSSLPLSSSLVNLICGDARSIKLDNESIGFIVTSPPYINVFNYHQNYRLAVEALGWTVLERAKSEIGSNRKHRGNRLYTVIQYSIDMVLFLKEMERLLLVGGRLILVVGRESNVRGMSFQNAEIFRRLLLEFKGLELTSEFSRKFTSRFGSVVYEEIMIIEKKSSTKEINSLKLLVSARLIGKEQLISNLALQPEPSRISDIEDAIERCDSINPSQMCSAL